MHELAIMERVLKTVLIHGENNQAAKIVAINLRVGELSDLLDEWMQRYFDYLSKDTAAQGAVLKIERTPIVCSCTSCNHSFAVSKDQLMRSCPRCGGDKLALTAGREFYIKDIEVM